MFVYEGSLRGLNAVALDGVVGKIHDFLFDDVTWDVRHVAIRSGPWFWGRIAVIPAGMFAPPDWHLQALAVRLGRDQVHSGPDIDTAPPVSRQEKIRLHHHQGSVLGIPYDGFTPALMVPTARTEKELAESIETILSGCDPHLRSCKAVRGYRVRLRSGETLGRAEDFVIDTGSWRITHIVIRIHTGPHPRRLVVPSRIVENISWHEHTIATHLSPQASTGRLGTSPGRSAHRVPSRGGKGVGPVSKTGRKRVEKVHQGRLQAGRTADSTLHPRK